jgi:hypothetical protein
MTGIDCIAALKALGELNRLRIVRLLLKEQLAGKQNGLELGCCRFRFDKLPL